MFKHKLIKYFYDPLYYGVIKGFDASAYYRFLTSSQWNSLEQNLSIQKEALASLLTFANTQIPYYKELNRFTNTRITPENVVEVLSDWPIMTKEIIRNHFDCLHHLNKDTRWNYNTSGGSTGEPVRLIQDRNFENMMMIAKRFQKEWTGYKVGDTMVKLWGSEQEIFKIKKRLKSRFSSWINAVYLMNAFMMGEHQMREYIDEINKRKPRLIVAYTQSANELAKYISRQGLHVYSPNAVLTSAGVLYPEFRSNIEQVFNCKVFNRYGSREVGDIACECEKHDGLHINLFTHHIEILDKNLLPCQEGELGDIYVTLLTNFTMPLIRYKIGDMAIFSSTKCSCGRGLPLIKHIVGRDVDVFINPENQLIDGEYFTHLFYYKNYVEKFQVIQKSPTFIVVIIQIQNQKAVSDYQRDQKELEHKIKIVMGDRCRVDFQLTDRIIPSKSGKYRYTIRDF